MKDKRIKLITKEMFIAWGLICALFLILDMFYWQSGIIELSTASSHIRLSPLGGMIFLLVILSNSLATIASHLIIIILLFLHIPEVVCATIGVLLFVVIQILFWGYLGDLTGRFIVWLKNLCKRKPPEAAVPPEPDN